MSSSCKEGNVKIPILYAKHTNIDVNIDNIYGAREITKAGKKRLVIGVNTSADTVYFLINLINKRIYPFGIKGRGPGEILSKSSPIYRKETNNFYFLDPMKRNYYSYSLDSVIYGNKLYTKKQFSFSGDNGFPFFFIPFNDSSYISTGTFKEGRYGLYSSVGKLLFTFGEFPENNENTKTANNMQLGAAFGGIIKSHPNKAMFVSVLRYSDLFEIYNKVSNEFVYINKNYVPKHPPCVKVINMGKRWSIASCKNSTLCFQQCSVSDKYIFITYSPHKMMSLANGKVNRPNIIRVYDWEGSYIANIKTDYPIRDFTVEREGNKHIFYAIAQNDSETSPYILVKYEVEI